MLQNISIIHFRTVNFGQADRHVTAQRCLVVESLWEVDKNAGPL